MKIVAYLRVSTDEQADSSAGLDAQLDACRQIAEGEVAAVYQDAGISGKAGLDKRPGLLAAIDALEAGDVLLVAKRDRIARDPLVMAMSEAAVQRKKARIASAAGEGTDSDSPSDVLMRRMVDAFAEYERLLIGARMRAALQGMRARGQRVGSIPYGYRLGDDGLLVEEASEQRIVGLVRQLRAGGATLRAIADELTARKMRPRGTCWHPQTIKNPLEAVPYGRSMYCTNTSPSALTIAF